MLKELLEDHTGGTSTIRVVAIVPTMVVCFGWFLMTLSRVYVAIKSNQLAELPSISLELSGFCAAMAGLKVWQRVSGEANTPPPAATPEIPAPPKV